jgi:ribosomal protein S18 acetylase RimI-like enzyme
MPVIREYRPEDAQQVAACFVALQDFLHRLEPQVLEGKAARPYFDFMLVSCRNTSGKIFVAEVENQIVGFICLWLKVQSEELDEEPAEYAFISDLVILPAYRSQGLGRALLQTAEEYARRHEATSLKLEVLAKNEGALSLYQRHGFSAYHLLLVKSLDS